MSFLKLTGVDTSQPDGMAGAPALGVPPAPAVELAPLAPAPPIVALAPATDSPPIPPWPPRSAPLAPPACCGAPDDETEPAIPVPAEARAAALPEAPEAEPPGAESISFGVAGVQAAPPTPKPMTSAAAAANLAYARRTERWAASSHAVARALRSPARHFATTAKQMARRRNSFLGFVSLRGGAVWHSALRPLPGDCRSPWHRIAACA
jgi:hypothetical protein